MYEGVLANLGKAVQIRSQKGQFKSSVSRNTAASGVKRRVRNEEWEYMGEKQLT